MALATWYELYAFDFPRFLRIESPRISIRCDERSPRAITILASNPCQISGAHSSRLSTKLL